MADISVLQGDADAAVVATDSLELMQELVKVCGQHVIAGRSSASLLLALMNVLRLFTEGDPPGVREYIAVLLVQGVKAMTPEERARSECIGKLLAERLREEES